MTHSFAMNIYFNALLINIFIILTVYLFLIYKYRHLVNKFIRLPGLKASLLTGSFSSDRFLKWIRITCSPQYGVKWIMEMAKEFQEDGNGLGRVISTPIIRAAILCTAETVQPLLSSKTEIKKPLIYESMKIILGDGLLTNNGLTWKKNRRRFNTTFQSNYLEKYIPIINTKIHILFTILDKSIAETNGVINDFGSLVKTLTFDIIFENGIGMPSDTQNGQDSIYLKSFEDYSDLYNRGLNLKMKDFLKKLISPWKLSNYLYKIIQMRLTSIKETHANKIEINDNQKSFLDNLLIQHINDPNSLTLKEIHQDLDVFLFAGHDTTSVTTLFCMLLIGINQNVQDKIYKELEHVYEDDMSRDFNWEDLNKLKYLEQCIKEAMRLYPSIPLIVRVNEQEIQVGDYEIPRFTNCFIPIYQLHRDEKYFPNSEIFDPDRFSAENISNIPPSAFIPFSAGIRSCVGQRYAMIEMKAILSSILRKYRVISLTKREEIEVHLVLVLNSATNIRIRFQKR